jgi:hypothetical protein
VNGVVVTQDVYKTRNTIPCGAMQVESVISFDELAWWNTEEKVLTKSRKVLHEVLKELNSMNQIKWVFGSAKRKSTGFMNYILLISTLFCLCF